MNELNYQELATVLAALRVFQQTRGGGGGIPAICYVPPATRDRCFPHTVAANIENMEHFETTAPLSDEQIDALCERLNSTDGARRVSTQHQTRPRPWRSSPPALREQPMRSHARRAATGKACLAPAHSHPAGRAEGIT